MAFHLFHGTDYFRLRRAFDATLGRLDLHRSDLTTFDGAEHPPSLTDLYQAAFSGSLFGPSGAVALHNTAAWLKWAFKGGAKALEKADLDTLHDLTHPPEDITVIFTEFEALLPKTPPKVWSAIAEGAGARIVQIDALKFIPFAPNPELEALLSGFAKEFPELSIEPLALRELGWRCGSDLGIAWAELAKYADWCAANPSLKVTPAQVQAATPPVVDIYIFDLIDAIAARQLTKSLALLHLVLRGGEPAPKILVLIHRQFKLMLWARIAQEAGERNLAGRLGVAPWMPPKLLKHAKAYERRQVPAILRYCLETDRALKTSAMPGDLALELLVTRLCTL